MGNPYTGKYAVTFEIEITREIGVFILADYERYFDKNNIDSKDTQNSDVALYWKLVHMYRRSQLPCETMRCSGLLYLAHI